MNLPRVTLASCLIISRPPLQTVNMLGESATPSSGGGTSVTNTMPQSHALSGKGDPQAFGAAGADTYAGSGRGVLGAGPKMRDRASAGDDTLVNREDFGKSEEMRKKAGTE
jgi:hypothetical protein